MDLRESLEESQKQYKELKRLYETQKVFNGRKDQENRNLKLTVESLERQVAELREAAQFALNYLEGEADGTNHSLPVDMGTILRDLLWRLKRVLRKGK
jgi:archaellum component FlaC